MSCQCDTGPMPSTATPPKHRTYEDIQALLTGTLFVAFGIGMFGHTGLLTNTGVCRWRWTTP